MKELGDRQAAICSVEAMGQLFNLPAIPGHDLFAWCVRSAWALREIEEVTKRSRVLEPLMKCALLEELYLF